MQLTFKQEKETKNTVRYQEQGEDVVIGPLYVQKSALGENPPAELSVSIELAEFVPNAKIEQLEAIEEELETVEETA